MAKEEPKYKPVTWSGDGSVMFLGGKAWATEHIEKKPRPPAVRAWETIPICLGDEGEVRAILDGKTAIPDTMPSRQVTVLAGILERIDYDRDSEPGLRKGGLERRSPPSVTRYKKDIIRLPKTKQRLPLHQDGK